MKRIIKFRAWDGEKMYDWDYLKRFTSNWLDNDDREGSFKPMQFTGLKDKNGKDIYEGDILAYKSMSYHLRVVKWNEKRGCFYFYKHGITDSEIQNQTVKNGDCLKLYVCGNIYENPKLLKEAQ